MCLYDFQFARLYFAEVHQLVDEWKQVFRIAFNKVQLFYYLWVVTQFQGALYGTDNQGYRSTEFMRDVGEEGYLVDGEFLHFASHLH